MYTSLLKGIPLNPNRLLWTTKCNGFLYMAVSLRNVAGNTTVRIGSPKLLRQYSLSSMRQVCMDGLASMVLEVAMNLFLSQRQPQLHFV